MTTPTREQIISTLCENEAHGIAADAILALFAEQTARVVELEADLDAENKLSLSIIDGWKAECATLEAELAARDFVPITDEHKGGRLWLTGWWKNDRWITESGLYEAGDWYADGYTFRMHPTHAAPLPQPPKEGE